MKLTLLASTGLWGENTDDSCSAEISGPHGQVLAVDTVTTNVIPCAIVITIVTLTIDLV